MAKVVLQGLPGIGKTTLIKKVSYRLRETAVEVTGFYTEETRDSRNYRTGFEIVTLENQRGILAKKSSAGNVNSQSKYRVGSYDVFVKEFEEIALPALVKVGSVYIIDEIGKMELFSKKFQTAVENIIADPKIKLVATVPLKGGGPLIQKIKNNNSVHLISVDVGNRNNLVEEIVSIIL